jgi:hypothetical protein
LNALLAAAAVLMLAIAGAAMIRASRYNHAADVNDGALMTEFQQLFPDWTTSNIPAVVESEHRKLTATTSSKVPAEARASALRTLHDVIATLPTGKGVVIDRMTFDDAMFELEGTAAALDDVDALTAAARKTGMNVSPPQSRREETGRWSFTLRGSKLASTASASQEGR